MNGHLFLDSPLHSLEPDAELILEQLAHGSYTAIAQVIDIILAVIFAVALHPQEVVNDLDEVSGLKQRISDPVLFGPPHLDVELQPSDTRQVKAPGVKEHTLEQPVSGRDRRRITRTHLAIDLEQSINRL